MIQHVAIHLSEKNDYSSLHGCGDIFDERTYGKNRTNTGKNQQEVAGLQSHDTTCRHLSIYQI